MNYRSPQHRRTDGQPPLVLVTVGTDFHPFDRLIEWTGRLLTGTGQPVRCLVQYGNSRPPEAATRTATNTTATDTDTDTATDTRTGTATGERGGSGRSGMPYLAGWHARQYLDHDELAEAMGHASLVVCHGGPATITEARRAGHLPLVVPRDPARGEHVDGHQLRFTRHLGSSGLVARCETEAELATALSDALADPGRFQLAGTGGTAAGEAAVPPAVHRVGTLLDALLGLEPDEPARAPVGISSSPGRDVPGDTAWPAVSVVVPTKDRPELLREAVAAVVAQDYPGRIHCLVVFDGTNPDPTLTSADRRREVSVASNTRTPGLAGARNSGILAADGELVAFCDDDDTWLPGKLRAQVERLVADPSASMVCCGIRVDYRGDTVDRALTRRRVGHADLLRSRLTELHPSTFVLRRRGLTDEFGLVDEDLPGSYAEDYDLLLRAARHGPVLNLPDVGVLVRWHAQSHFASRWATIAEALTLLLRRHPAFRRVPRGYARVAGQIAFAQAAVGNRREALRWTWRTLTANPAEARAYLALTVTTRATEADTVLRRLQAHGRGL